MSDTYHQFNKVPGLADRPESVRYRQVLTTGQPPTLTDKTRERATRLFRRNS